MTDRRGFLGVFVAAIAALGLRLTPKPKRADVVRSAAKLFAVRQVYPGAHVFADGRHPCVVQMFFGPSFT